MLGSPEDTPAVGFQINADAAQKHVGTSEVGSNIIALVAVRSHALEMMQWAASLRALGIACEVYETVQVHKGETPPRPKKQLGEQPISSGTARLSPLSATNKICWQRPPGNRY
jgi:hypothetical protein